VILLLAAIEAPESFAANTGEVIMNGDTVSRLMERMADSDADDALAKLNNLRSSSRNKGGRLAEQSLFDRTARR
jgi:hypothetical protein